MKKILVLEDEASIRSFIVINLRRAGYDVIEAESGEEALERLRHANIPQVTFTGGEPTLRADLVELAEAAQWFVTRLNTNGRLLTPELCRRPPVDSFLFFLYYTIVPPAISTPIPQNLKIFLPC